MPAMLRLNELTKKIAYKILGTPPNLRKDQPKRDPRVEKRLVFEETQRVR